MSRKLSGSAKGRPAKQPSALAMGASGANTGTMTFWFDDPKKLAARVANDPAAMEELQRLTRRKRGAPGKHSLAFKMQVFDEVEWILRSGCDERTASELSLKHLPEGTTADQVRGIYERERKKRRGLSTT